MNAEIISVGTELLLGQVVNTDAAIVARELSRLGMNLLHASVVGDNPLRLKTAIEMAVARSDLLIMTGGLGPTEDDLTKETAAACAGKPLVLHEESLRRITTYFHTDHVSENQRKQAMLPEGCTVFANDNGTAPGCAFETETGCRIIMLPGPPSELAPMLTDKVVPYLSALQNAVIVSRNVHVFGMGEAAAARMMKDLTDQANPTVAPYANEGEMYFRVTAKGATQEAAADLCKPVVEEIQRRLGPLVYSVEQDTLEATVVALLAQRGMTLATAESCTGGLLAKRITDVPGASAVFEMGCVTYANAAKEELLAVPPDMLSEHGAVSREVAAAMAAGIQAKAGAAIGIGITGIAGPDGGTAEKPVGLIYIALCDGKEIYVTQRTPIGRRKSRVWQRHCAASQALDMVRRYVTGLPVCEYPPIEGPTKDIEKK